MYGDFPFTIRDVAWLLNLHIRHKNTVSLDADCPFCGERKGKLNINLKKNVFKCNRCGESGGMLALYAKVYGVDNQTACREIKEKLGRNEQAPCHMAATTGTASNEPVVENAKTATDAVKDRTYTMLFSMLALAPTHRQELLKRGFTNGQIDANGYKSTPVFGFKSLVKKLADAGCTVKGVPGFYQDNDGEWSIYFNPKSAGYMIPVRNTNGMITGVQIRLDHPYDGRKYIWLSSINRHMGASSGSPIHLVGEPGAKTLFITEGPLKGDLSHALSGRTFGCVPGANQYANLAPFLKEMKALGTEFVYETYDMDKLLKTVCHGDYNEKCVHCPRYYEDWGHATIMCDKKMTKRNNIQRGCGRLAAICRELGLPGRTLTWDLDADGDWAGHVKGVDDYLAELVEGQKTYSKE